MMSLDPSVKSCVLLILLLAPVSCQEAGSSATPTAAPITAMTAGVTTSSPLNTFTNMTAPVTATPTVSSTASAATTLPNGTSQVQVAAASSSSNMAAVPSNTTTAKTMANETLITLSRGEQTATSTIVTAANTTSAPTVKTTLKPRDCNEQLMQVDGCIKRIVLIGDREAIIPKTVKELEDNHCNRIKGELVCVREYGKVCLKLFPRTIFAIVRKNVEKVFKTLCTNADGKAMAVKHLGCFKPANLIVLHSIVDKITHTLEYIEKNTTDTQIIPYMCCAFYTFYRETKMIVDNMCLNSTGPGTSEFIISIIKAVVTDALDLGCGQYGSYRKCSDNLPHGIAVFTQIFQHDKYSNSTYALPAYSPVVPMIAISKRLDSGF